MKDSRLKDVLDRKPMPDSQLSQEMLREVNCLIWRPQGWKLAPSPQTRFRGRQRIS